MKTSFLFFILLCIASHRFILAHAVQGAETSNTLSLLNDAIQQGKVEAVLALLQDPSNTLNLIDVSDLNNPRSPVNSLYKAIKARIISYPNARRIVNAFVARGIKPDNISFLIKHPDIYDTIIFGTIKNNFDKPIIFSSGWGESEKTIQPNETYMYDEGISTRRMHVTIRIVNEENTVFTLSFENNQLKIEEETSDLYADLPVTTQNWKQKIDLTVTQDGKLLLSYPSLMKLA